MSWREARSSPLIPPGSLSQSRALLRAQLLAELKRKSVRVGHISHFLPCLRPKEGACKATMWSWKYSLPHRRCGGSVVGLCRAWAAHILAVGRLKRSLSVCHCNSATRMLRKHACKKKNALQLCKFNNLKYLTAADLFSLLCFYL